MPSPTEKRCGRCKTIKPLDEEHFKRHKRDGWQSYCIPCSSDWAKENYRKNRDKRLAKQNQYNRERRARREGT